MDSFKTIKPLERVPELPTLGQVNSLANVSATVIANSKGILFDNLGGFGIGLGIGAAVATPLGNFAVGDGQSK